MVLLHCARFNSQKYQFASLDLLEQKEPDDNYIIWYA